MLLKPWEKEVARKGTREKWLEGTHKVTSREPPLTWSGAGTHEGVGDPPCQASALGTPSQWPTPGSPAPQEAYADWKSPP